MIIFYGHPEPRRRRGTSHALNRLRETRLGSVSAGKMFGGSRNLQVRGPSARFASLGMTALGANTKSVRL
jgi:hypothetical protein